MLCDLPCPKGTHLSWQLRCDVVYVSEIESISDFEDLDQTWTGRRKRGGIRELCKGHFFTASSGILTLELFMWNLYHCGWFFSWENGVNYPLRFLFCLLVCLIFIIMAHSLIMNSVMTSSLVEKGDNIINVFSLSWAHDSFVQAKFQPATSHKFISYKTPWCLGSNEMYIWILQMCSGYNVLTFIFLFQVMPRKLILDLEYLGEKERFLLPSRWFCQSSCSFPICHIVLCTVYWKGSRTSQLRISWLKVLY